MSETAVVKVYPATSVWWCACVAEAESIMVVVVEETWMVGMERCCGREGGLVA